MAIAELVATEILATEGISFVPSLGVYNAVELWSNPKIIYYEDKIYFPFINHSYYPRTDGEHSLQIAKKESSLWSTISGPGMLSWDNDFDYPNNGSVFYSFFTGFTMEQIDNLLYFFYCSSDTFSFSPHGLTNGEFKCSIFDMDTNTFTAHIGSNYIGYFIRYNFNESRYEFFNEQTEDVTQKRHKIVSGLRSNGKIFLAINACNSETGFLTANKLRFSLGSFNTNTNTFNSFSIHGLGDTQQDYSAHEIIVGDNDNIHLFYRSEGSAGANLKQMVFDVNDSVILNENFISVGASLDLGYFHKFTNNSGDTYLTYAYSGTGTGVGASIYRRYNLTTLSATISEGPTNIETPSEIESFLGIDIANYKGLITIDIDNEYQSYSIAYNNLGQLTLFRNCITEGGFVFDPVQQYIEELDSLFNVTPSYQVFAQRKDVNTLAIIFGNRNRNILEDNLIGESYRTRLYYLELEIPAPCSGGGSINPSDSFTLSDSILVRLHSSSLPNFIVLDKCPTIFNSAYCQDWKEGQNGTEDPLACPPQFFEIGTDPCPEE